MSGSLSDGCGGEQQFPQAGKRHRVYPLQPVQKGMPRKGIEVRGGMAIHTALHDKDMLREYLLSLIVRTYQRLYGHGAVHQANAGVGGVSVHTGIGKGGILVAAEFQDGVIHLGFVENSNT